MATLIFVAAFCIVAMLVYMARYSGRIKVFQTRVIDAPLSEVYPRIADFQRWAEWSPWSAFEPEAATTITGKSDTAGSRYTWESALGSAGFIEHVRLVARERIEQRLRFKYPFRVRGKSYWQFTDLAGKTEVTWSLKGRVAFSLRAFAATVQGMIALDYRYGLDRLAGLVEPVNAPRYALEYLGVREIPASRYIFSTYTGPLAGLGAAMPKGFAELRQQIASRGIPPSGAPIAVYVKTNIKLRTTVCHMGIPIADADCERLLVRNLPAHRAYVVRLQGGYAALEIAWYQAMQRMRIENIQPDQRIPPFERYLNDPSTAPENDLLTELHIPLRQKAHLPA